MGTRTFSKIISAVSWECMPALASLRPRRKPGMPRSTTSRLIPRAPAEGSVFATTITRSEWMPLVMNVFVPLRR